MLAYFSEKPIYLKIIVGSKNPVKVRAVREIIQQYDFLRSAQVFSFAASSGVSSQPLSLSEAVLGAMNRAAEAFRGKKCNLSFGIESGLMQVPATKSGFMDVCVCAIFDGHEPHLGLSSAFECPPATVEMVRKGGLDLNQAFKKAGITKKEKLGNFEGAIGLLTKMRITRIDYTKQAIMTALIHLENPGLYKTK